MEVISLIIGILSLLVGIIGIIVSIYCWKNAYKEISLIKDLYGIDLSQECSIAQIRDVVSRLLKFNPDIYFSFINGSFSDEKILKHNIISALANTFANADRLKG